MVNLEKYYIVFHVIKYQVPFFHTSPVFGEQIVSVLPFKPQAEKEDNDEESKSICIYTYIFNTSP
jgi:hypothetical protein